LDNKLETYSVPSVQLELFDGSRGSMINQAIDLQIRFPSGEITPISFYVTKLDPGCPAVIGYSWLSRYNPSIDWELSQLFFNAKGTPLQDPPSAEPPSPNSDFSPKPTPAGEPETPPSISLVNAVAFIRAAKLPGTQTFKIFLSESGIAADAPRPPPEDVNLDFIPEEYHDFADVFSKQKASILAEH